MTHPHDHPAGSDPTEPLLLPDIHKALCTAAKNRLAPATVLDPTRSSAQARYTGVVGRFSRRSGVIAIISTAVVATAATAAVVAGTSSPSAPSAGTLPNASPSVAQPGVPATLGSSATYAITMRPDLRTGQTGWCTNLTVRGASGSGSSGGVGCGPAATTSQPFIAGSTQTAPGTGGSVSFAIVADGITTLRLRSGHLLTPRPGTGIPNDWRAFVVLPDTDDSPAAYLNAQGAEVDTKASAVGPDGYVRSQPKTVTDGPPSDSSVCRIDADRKSVVRRTEVLRDAPQPEPDVNGRAFLPCASALIHRPDGDVTATILLDARNPADAPADLPATRPLADAPGLVATDPDTIGEAPAVARRIANAWLVVQAGDPLELSEDRSQSKDVDLVSAARDLNIAIR